MKRSRLIRTRRRIRQLGKKGKLNQRTNRILVKNYDGHQHCEARLPGCWGNVALSWAHHSKRRKLTEEELLEAALCCIPCHEIIERFSPEDMKLAIKAIINRRVDSTLEAA